MKVKDLLKSKTFWAGATLIVGSTAAVATGEVDKATAIQSALIGLMGIFIRNSIGSNASK